MVSLLHMRSDHDRARHSGEWTGAMERRDFARIPTIIDLPNLIEVQQKSYARFLQQERPPLDREDRGLEAVFRSVFPIADFNGMASLEYAGYEIGMWESEEGEYKGLGGCWSRGRKHPPASYIPCQV